MAKMIKCKTCSKEIASSAKTCPECGAKNSKPFYKRWWVWVIAIIILASLGGGSSETETVDTASKAEAQQTDTTEAPKAEPKKEEVKVPKEYTSALKQADTYGNKMNMSKKGIYDQLVSEHGGQFSAEAAQYAIDNVKVDWNKAALASAKTYQDMMSMSPNAIYDQLTSEHGGQFTKEEAQYAIDNLE